MTEPKTYVALKDCGCVAVLVLNSPEHANAVAKEVAEGIRDGYTFQLMDTEDVRRMPFLCPKHSKAARDANKEQK